MRRMNKYDVYKSEGGYRVAAELVNGGPVISYSLGKKWYETRRAAQCAANNAKRVDRSYQYSMSKMSKPHRRTDRWARQLTT